MNYKIENAKTTFFTSKEHYLAFRKAWAVAVNSDKAKNTKTQYSWITGGHMMLFNALCGKDIRTGFTPITRKNKLLNGSYINEGTYKARRNIQNGTESFWMEEFLAPFAETVSLEMVEQVNKLLPAIPMIYSNYGTGKKVTEKIISGEVTISTIKELDELMSGVTPPVTPTVTTVPAEEGKTIPAQQENESFFGRVKRGLSNV